MASRPQFRATELNWKPEYTTILRHTQKGLPREKIAELTGYGTIMLGRIVTSPYFKERLNKANIAYEKRLAQKRAENHTRDVTATKLEASAKRAASILVKALKGDPSITKQQISVARDLLDRTGYKAKERIELETRTRDYTPEEIESAQATMLEMTETLERLTNRDTNFLVSPPNSRLGSDISDAVMEEEPEDAPTSSDTEEGSSDEDAEPESTEQTG